jgi:hypothetical protein
MARIAILLAVALFCWLNAEAPSPRAIAAISAHLEQPPPDADGSFYCPMDPDVRSVLAGACPKCGMKLVEGVPDLVEYRLDLALTPAVPLVSKPTRLTLGVIDPRTMMPVRRFEIVHERLYHIFLVSQDLSFFLHTHPERSSDEDFHLDVQFPKPGIYRVLSDFYPSGGSPQLITNTIIVPGEVALNPAAIDADTSPKQTENSRVELSVAPTPTLAGQVTSLLLRVTPDQGVEQYLGAWGHMLAVSSDLVDMVHSHPTGASDAKSNAYKEIKFDLVFPRAGVYRVWVQFQRLGVVNTVAFNIPVGESAP